MERDGSATFDFKALVWEAYEVLKVEIEEEERCCTWSDSEDSELFSFSDAKGGAYKEV